MSSCQLSSAVVSTPIGPYNISACKFGLHSVQSSPEVTNDNFLEKGSKEIVLSSTKDVSNRHLVSLRDWLRIYFDDVTVDKNFPEVEVCREVVDVESDVFSQKILSTLWKKVPFGTKLSYGELAALAGKSSKSARAVGSVMANNDIALVIPCHRIVKSDGSDGNYAKASKNDVKKWLLQHESRFERKG